MIPVSTCCSYNKGQRSNLTWDEPTDDEFFSLQAVNASGLSHVKFVVDQKDI